MGGDVSEIYTITTTNVHVAKHGVFFKSKTHIIPGLHDFNSLILIIN